MRGKKSGVAIGFFFVFALVIHCVTSLWLDKVESSCENAKCYLD